jgi:hypothetical protein
MFLRRITTDADQAFQSDVRDVGQGLSSLSSRQDA